MAGRWLLSSPGRGQCNMTFGSAAPAAVEGTIAPEGGCPGKFFTSRKWTFEQAGLMMRDHNGQPLAQLSGEGGGRFDGKATSGEPVTLLALTFRSFCQRDFQDQPCPNISSIASPSPATPIAPR